MSLSEVWNIFASVLTLVFSAGFYFAGFKYLQADLRKVSIAIEKLTDASLRNAVEIANLDGRVSAILRDKVD